MLRVRAAQGVSEAAREHETFKYDPALIDGIVLNDTSKPLDSSQLFTADDTVLTSLAQLGATRTRTSRSLISLFDQRWQYIIAEATPDLPLLPSIRQHELEGEALWLSRTAIPRVHGVCNHTLIDPGQKNDSESELPLTISSDLTADPRFCDKPYCMPGSSARFYAAVPIRSPGGINIGVYCVIDETPKPVDEWTARDTAVLRHISRAVMSHLDFRSTKDRQRMSERMIRGIASFMQADVDISATQPTVNKDVAGHLREAPTLPRSPQTCSSTNRDVFDDQGSDNYQPNFGSQNSSESVSVPLMSETIESLRENNPPTPTRTSSPSTSGSMSPPLGTVPDLDYPTLVKRVFDSSARIIQDSIAADGMVFVKALTVRLDILVDSSETSLNEHDRVADSASGGNDDNADCHVLGSAISGLPTNATNTGSLDIKISTRFFSTLCRKYPTGKIFVFDEYGLAQNLDIANDNESMPLPSSYGQSAASRLNIKGNNTSTTDMGAQAVYKCFRGARSVLFVPLRDDIRGRWFAAAFAYANNPTRVFTTSMDLSFIQTFNILIMAEIHRVEVTMAHWAKSDMLNSLSHELRSPLHGVILSTELLADTHLDVFQEDILRTLENCGRTLTDTIDHMLDFSKINNYLKSTTAEKRSAARTSAGENTSIEAGMTNLYSKICLDVLVEEVVESVFAGHNYQHSLAASLARRATAGANGFASRLSNSTLATKSLAWVKDDMGQSPYLNDEVSVHLDIDHEVSAFQFSSMAGALRRIVMNLFGNALKYTEAGQILVSLSIDDGHDKSTDNNHKVMRLTISDTGKGMSADFIQNDLYKPFRQVDQLSPGTGLGLSLVRKIVTLLKGDITITSEVGTGTVATVFLPLSTCTSVPEGPDERNEHDEVQDHKRRLRGLRICLAGFEVDASGFGQRFGFELPIKKLCREWLDMDTATETERDPNIADVVVCSESKLGELSPHKRSSNKPPVIVVCSNARVAHERSLNAGDHADSVYEFVSQPVGPLKLARVLFRTLKRWADMSSVTPPAPGIDAGVESSGPASIAPSASAVPFRVPFRDGKHPGESSENSRSSDLVSTRSRSAFSSPDGPSTWSTPARTVTPPPLKRPPTPNVKPVATQSALEKMPTPGPQTEFLLVDDNPINLRLLGVYMQKLGRSYTTAVDGQEAVEKYKAQPDPFKYIFMDISMPRLDGMEATRQIRLYEREKRLGRATVFALSALASSKVQEEAFSSGIDLFLTKPVKLEELSALLANSGEFSPPKGRSN